MCGPSACPQRSRSPRLCLLDNSAVTRWEPSVASLAQAALALSPKCQPQRTRPLPHSDRLCNIASVARGPTGAADTAVDSYHAAVLESLWGGHRTAFC